MTDQPVDPLGKVTETDDLLGKIRGTLSGFVGYVERDQRRESDKLLRDIVAQRHEEQWSRISELQRRLIAENQLRYVDDLEVAAVKIRTFVDRVQGATYGYAGLFDHARIGNEELAALYAFDLELLDGTERLENAVDVVEASIGTEEFESSVRHLQSVAQGNIDTFERRGEVILAE